MCPCMVSPCFRHLCMYTVDYCSSDSQQRTFLYNQSVFPGSYLFNVLVQCSLIPRFPADLFLHAEATLVAHVRLILCLHESCVATFCSDALCYSYHWLATYCSYAYNYYSQGAKPGTGVLSLLPLQALICGCWYKQHTATLAIPGNIIDIQYSMHYVRCIMIIRSQL